MLAVLSVAQTGWGESWIGAGGDDNWTTSGNWNAGDVPENPDTDNVTFSAADSGNTGILTSNWQIGGITAWQNTVSGGANQTINLNSKTLTVAGDIDIANQDQGANPYSSELKFTGGTLQVGTPSVPVTVDIGSINTSSYSNYTARISFVSNVTLVPHIKDMRIGFQCNNQSGLAALDLRNATIPGGVLSLDSLTIGHSVRGVSALVMDNSLNILNTLTVANSLVISDGWGGKARIGYATGGADDEYKLPAGFTVNVGSAAAPASSLVVGRNFYSGNGLIRATSGGSFTAYVDTMQLADLLGDNQTRTTKGIVDLTTMNSCLIDVGTLIVAKEYTPFVKATAIGSLKLPKGTLEADVVEVGAYKTAGSGLIELDGTNFKINSSLTIRPTGTISINVKTDANNNNNVLDLSSIPAPTIETGGKIKVNFINSPPGTAAYYGLAWQGNHISELQALQTAGKLVIDSTAIAPLTATIFMVGNTTVIGIPAQTTPAGIAWDGGGTNDNWSTANNWGTNTVPANPEGNVLNFSAVDSGNTGIVTSNWQIGGIKSWQNTVTGSGATQTINLNSKTLTVTGNVDIADRSTGGDGLYSSELKFTSGTLQIGKSSVPVNVDIGSINTGNSYAGKMSFVSNVTLVPHIKDLRIGFNGGTSGSGGTFDLRNATIPGGKLALDSLLICQGVRTVSALVMNNSLTGLDTLTVASSLILSDGWGGKARMGYATGGADDEHKLPAGFTVNVGSASAPASSLVVGRNYYSGNGLIRATSGGSFTAYANTMQLADLLGDGQTRTTYGIVDLATMGSCTIDVGTLVVAKDYTPYAKATAIGKLQLPVGTLEADAVEVGAHKAGSSGLIELNGTHGKINTSLAIRPTGIVRVNVQAGSDGKFNYLNLASASLTIETGGKIELNFLQEPSTFVDCNGLVMDGDHVSELEALVTAGKLVINDSSIAPTEAVIYKNGSKTYVGIRPGSQGWQQALIAYYPSYNKAAVKFRESLLTTPDKDAQGNLVTGLRVTVFNTKDCTGDVTYTTVLPEPLDVKWWQRKVDQWIGPVEMTEQTEASARFEGWLGPIPQGGVWSFHFVTSKGTKLWLDDQLAFDSDLVPEAFNALAEVELEQGRTYRFVMDYTHPTASKNIDVTLNYWRKDGRTPITADLVIDDPTDAPQNPPTVEQEFTWTPPATYPVVVTLANPLPKLETPYNAQVICAGYNTVSQPLYNQSFDWETGPDSQLGITQTIYPPFQAVTYNTSTKVVTAVMRQYVQDGIGLWNSVKATINDNMANGYQEILAAPMKLVANGTAVTGTGSFDTQASTNYTVVYNGQSTSGPVNITTHCETEIDGVMKVTMTLGTGSVNSMYLEIPLKQDMTPLYHVVRGPNPIRHNVAAATPDAWNSKVRDNGENWPGNFKPYMWFGAEERGLAWFADNEKGWELDWGSTSSLPAWLQHGYLLFTAKALNLAAELGTDADPCQTLSTASGVRTLRVHFIQKPVTITTPRTITFGLMASPGKPMPTDWRTDGRSDSPRLGFTMGHRWGLDSNNAAKYPRHRDWVVMDKYYYYRQNGGLTNQVRDDLTAQWMATHVDPYPAMDQALKDSFENLVHLGFGTGNGQHAAGASTRFTSYFDECHSTTPWHYEIPTYEAEWYIDFRVRDWPNMPAGPLTMDHKSWSSGTGNFSPTYQNFATWAGKQWLDRAIGLYFDNSFLMACRNPVISNAYVRPDGGVQPSAQIWARRDYLRRIWNMHQQYKNTSWPQAMMCHMTNTHILPMHTWNEYNLDLEWGMGSNHPFQKKFTDPSLVRAESLGLQTGTYPHAMSSPGGVQGEPGSPERLAWEYNERTHLLGMYIHEIRGPEIGTAPMPIEMETFGYGLSDCVVYHYWDQNPAIAVTDTLILPGGVLAGDEEDEEETEPQDPEEDVIINPIPFKSCKWLLLKRNGNLFLALVSWDPNPQTVALDFNYTTLGVSVPGGARQWVDLDTSTTLTPDANGDITVNMAGYGIGLFQLD